MKNEKKLKELVKKQILEEAKNEAKNENKIDAEIVVKSDQNSCQKIKKQDSIKLSEMCEKDVTDKLDKHSTDDNNPQSGRSSKNSRRQKQAEHRARNQQRKTDLKKSLLNQLESVYSYLDIRDTRHLRLPSLSHSIQMSNAE